jgi:hypothetical protein
LSLLTAKRVPLFRAPDTLYSTAIDGYD